MKQNQALEQIFFLSSPPMDRNEDFLGVSPLLRPLEPELQSVGHLLSLESQDHLLNRHLPDKPFFQNDEEISMSQDRLCISQDTFLSSSLNLCNGSEVFSTKASEINWQNQPPFLQLCLQSSASRAKDLIQFLLEHSQLTIEVLNMQLQHFWMEDPKLEEVFHILVHKFKSLRKTNEEMTKYCMRKAFKFVEDLIKKQKSPSLSFQESIKQYCSEQRSSVLSFLFKKESSEKTMNAKFLQQVFSCPKFKQDYLLFLEQFDTLAAEDNQSKISYLVSQVEHALTDGSIEHLRKIGRLPWTKKILRQAHKLAASLVDGKIEKRKRGKLEQ